MCPVLKEPVGGKIDPSDAVVSRKGFDDFREILSHEGLAPGDPQISDRGHGLGDSLDLFQGEITALVQLLPVEAVAAFLIADRGHEEHHGV